VAQACCHLRLVRLWHSRGARKQCWKQRMTPTPMIVVRILNAAVVLAILTTGMATDCTNGGREVISGTCTSCKKHTHTQEGCACASSYTVAGNQGWLCKEIGTNCLSEALCTVPVAKMAPCDLLEIDSDYLKDCINLSPDLTDRQRKDSCPWVNYRTCTNTGGADTPTDTSATRGYGYIERFVQPALITKFFDEGYGHLRVEKPDYGSVSPRMSVFGGQLVAKAEVIVLCNCWWNWHNPQNLQIWWDGEMLYHNNMKGWEYVYSDGTYGTERKEKGQQSVQDGAMENELSTNLCAFRRVFEPGDYTGNKEVRCMHNGNQRATLGTWIKPL